ncbi:MAG: glycoside hydrolase family 2 TIM barrel-domain containing protein, partial [Candidatus Omnitrophica bacterium]|nr:glycoside hydrolase family 2 TIM barrel-domain containing protein [Candidatus Omnitrophota bacterium]
MIRGIMRGFLFSGFAFLFFQIYPLHTIFPEVEKPSDTRFPAITVKNGVLLAGDEELFLNAIGYSGIRPGKDQFDPVQDDKSGYAFIEEDMRRIKEAGFNAIRTYALLDEKILELAEKYGLWVLAGIWTEQGTLPHNEAHVQRAIDTIIRDAKIYAKHSNIALLFLSNEPHPDCLYNPVTTKYMKRVVKVAHENCPGVPVSFANMPNAAFVSPEPWDVVSFNIYACGFEKFTSSVGYRGLVEGIKKISSGDKPFLISEYGFYAPVPKPNMKEPWIFYRVKDESEQSKKLLRDRELLSQTGLAGMTMMMWHDDWRNFNDVPAAQAYLQDPPKTKFIHDMFTQEWGGIVAFDEDPVGKPRKAYFDLRKENQAVLMSPDSEMIYKQRVPVKMYITQQVESFDLYVDGRPGGKINRISPHWVEYKLPPFPESSLKKHEVV